MARAGSGQAVLVVLVLVAATGSVAAAQPAPSQPGTLHSEAAPVSALGLNETTDAAASTIDDATNTTDSTVDSTGDTTTEAVDDTTNTTEDATDTTTEDATDTTTEDATDTTNTTGDTADATTETVDGTTTATTTTESTDTTGDAVENTTDTAASLVDGDAVSVDSTESNSTDATAAVTAAGDAVSDATTRLSGTTNTLTEAAETLESSSDSLVGETIETETDLGDGFGPVLGSGSDARTSLDADYATGTDQTGTPTGARADGDGPADQTADSDTASGVSAVSGEGGSGDAGSDGGGDGVVAGALARLQQLDNWIPDEVPTSAAGATGIGALALAAAASRQWLTQTAGSGAPGLLTSGVGARVDGWLERLWRLVVPAGYSRHDDSDPLDHDTRRVLCEAIDSTPGIYLAELAERTDIPVSTVRYHVRVLADEQLITTAKRRGKRRYYPPNADDVALADALGEPAKAAVLRALAEHGEAHVGLLADELDRDPSTVTHHLQTLDDDGLVEREQRGRTVVNRLSDGVETTLASASSAAGSDTADAPADD